jgi:iron-sulfur cluster repair protein YtfE (RIC family)
MNFRQEKIEGRFLKIAQEHEQVLDYLDRIKHFLDPGKTAADFSEIQNLFTKFKPDILHHFKIEERFLFPAALLSMPEIELTDMILTLQKEHGFFERDIGMIENAISENPAGNRIPDELKKLLKKLIADLENHAAIELDQLFPRMDANKKCSKIIKGILLEE